MGVQNSKDFPYDVLEPISTFQSPVWTMHVGQKRDDKTPVSIFVFDKKKTDKLPVAQNTFKRFKTLRHPNILRYVDGIELETSIYIVTEEVKPLVDRIQEIKSQGNSISWGLYTIAKAVGFMNGGNLLHGNVTAGSVFVTKAGDWKLGGLDLVSDLNDSESIWKRFNGEVLPAKYRPPEIEKGSAWEILQKQPISSLDSWLYGCLVCEVFNNGYTKADDLKKGGKIPKDLMGVFQLVTSTNPKSRITMEKLLEAPYFANALIETCLFLENITIKDTFEKENFFKKLGPLIDQLPQPLCKYKILPHLVTALDYGSANAKVLQPVLKIGSMLTNEEFMTCIIPSVVKWFASNDRALRANLLQNLNAFVEHLSASVIDEQIFPHVAAGFTDPAPALRELTIKAMLLLAPKLTEKNLTLHVLKHFNRLQMDSEPGIRTNTTICLGKISVHLPQHVRQKVLIPAFARAMRDPFPPARSSGILALTATQEFYSPEDAAMKIIPSLSMLTIDPDKSVRENSFVGMKTFIKKLEQMSQQRMKYEQEHTAHTANAPGGQPSGNPNDPSDSGWAGWALNSLSKKIYGEEGSPGTQQAGQAGRVTASPSPSAISQPVPKTANAASIASAPKVPVQTTPSHTAKKTDDWNSFDGNDRPKLSTVVDDWNDADDDGGWGDDDIAPPVTNQSSGWGDLDFNDPTPASKGGKTPSSSILASPSQSKKASSSSSGWGDFDDADDTNDSAGGSGWGDDDVDFDDDPTPKMKQSSATKTAITSSVKQSGSTTTLPVSKSASSSSRSSFDDGWGSDDWSTTKKTATTPAVASTSTPSPAKPRKEEEEWEDFDVDVSATKPAATSQTTAGAKGKMSKLELARLKREESKKKAEEKRASKAQ